jgi:hypothetical protein
MEPAVTFVGSVLAEELLGDAISNSVVLGELLRIQGYDKTVTPWGTIAAGAIASLMVVLAVWKSTITFIAWCQKPIDSPKRLFEKLIQVHKLNRLESAMVRQVASRLPKEVPSSILFVDPMYWHSAAIETGDENLRREVFQKIFDADLDRYKAASRG